MAREREKLGLTCTANAVLTDIVKRVERGELSPDPKHITKLRFELSRGPEYVFVMAGLDPAIHVFLAAPGPRRGCPVQARP